MGKCQFVVEVKENLENLFSRALNEGRKFGANIKGDVQSGQFEVKILGALYKGSYSTSGNKISIIISEKPFYITCRTIESLVKKYIEI